MQQGWVGLPHPEMKQGGGGTSSRGTSGGSFNTIFHSGVPTLKEGGSPKGIPQNLPGIPPGESPRGIPRIPGLL